MKNDFYFQKEINNEIHSQNKINKNKILNCNSSNNKIYNNFNQNIINKNKEKDKKKDRLNIFDIYSPNDKNKNNQNSEKPMENKFLEKKRKKIEVSAEKTINKNKGEKEKESIKLVDPIFFDKKGHKKLVNNINSIPNNKKNNYNKTFSFSCTNDMPIYNNDLNKEKKMKLF